MTGVRFRIDKTTERAVREILSSRAESRIYLYLLRKKGARSEEIIKGTRLHPSTVRELLSKMYEQRVIYRKKLKNDSIGKNPYLYHPAPPIKLLQKKAKELEDRLNKLAKITTNRGERPKRVRIKITNWSQDV
jgi:predicted DNA-binding transcriptional regulator